MAKLVKRICPACGQLKEFRSDNKTCGCKGYHPWAAEPAAAPATEINEVKGNQWTISLPKTRIHTLDELLEFCKVDTSVWEVERFIVNKWEMGFKNALDIADTIPLYQVKAFLRRKVEVAAAANEIAALKELAQTEMPLPSPKVIVEGTKGGMLEINLTDHHFGKQAWGLETGWANYDVKIATRAFHSALDTILNRSPFARWEEIWFVVGNDLFNADNTAGQTTSGTQVESDVRHEKTYVTVRTLMVQAIEKLRHLADVVHVIVVPGNHDHNATWHLGDSLELYFSQYDDVQVDNRPGPRKYHVFGQTLIGYAHGDKGKLKDLPLLMATEAREEFGATKFHEWHTGHTHQTKTEETHGIRVRVLPALCPPDAWHAENGFVGNLRSSEAFVWDAKEGLIGIVIYTDSDALIEKASQTPSVVRE